MKVSDVVSKSDKFQGFKDEKLSSVMVRYLNGEIAEVCKERSNGLKKFEVEEIQLNQSSQEKLNFKKKVQSENEKAGIELLEESTQMEGKRAPKESDDISEEVLRVSTNEKENKNQGKDDVEATLKDKKVYFFGLYFLGEPFAPFRMTLAHLKGCKSNTV